MCLTSWSNTAGGCMFSDDGESNGRRGKNHVFFFVAAAERSPWKLGSLEGPGHGRGEAANDYLVFRFTCYQ